MNRRSFLKTSSALTAAAASGVSAAKPEDLFKISLAQWSLNRRHRDKEQPAIDPLDFAKTAKGLDIHAVEYVNQFFMDKAKDQAYLGDLKTRAEGEGVKSLLIMIDREGNLGEPDEAKRKQAVENHFKWVEAAKFLGCHSIRVNARSDGNLRYDEQMKLAADGLRQLSEFGAEQEMNVIVENHGGLSSHGKWLAGVMKMVDHERCGTLPDFGNFLMDRKKMVWYDRYQGVKELMPYAKAVSAKANDFDPKRPFSTFHGDHETDYIKMMKIVLDAGYHGYVGIEAEGAMDQIEGIKATRDLLIRVRKKMAG